MAENVTLQSLSADLAVLKAEVVTLAGKVEGLLASYGASAEEPSTLVSSLSHRIERFIQDYPRQAVSVAAAVAFLSGLTWRR